MHREAIRRRAIGLFGDGRGRALRLGDDAGSQGFGGRLVGIPPFRTLLGAKSRSLVKPVSARPEVICRGWRGNFYNYNLDQVEAQAVR